MRFSQKRLIATVTGAVTMFVWGGFSPMVLLKGAGFNRVSDEERIVSALRTSLPGDGLYFLPSIDIRGNPSAEETAAWAARFRAGPTGMIVYHSAGDAPVSRKKLSVQFLTVGSLWMVRHQFYLLELVGISECLFFLRKAWTCCRLVTGRRRRRQADSAREDLIAAVPTAVGSPNPVLDRDSDHVAWHSKGGLYESSCSLSSRSTVLCSAPDRCDSFRSSERRQAHREAAQPGPGVPEGRKQRRPANGPGTVVHTDE